MWRVRALGFEVGSRQSDRDSLGADVEIAEPARRRWAGDDDARDGGQHPPFGVEQGSGAGRVGIAFIGERVVDQGNDPKARGLPREDVREIRRGEAVHDQHRPIWYVRDLSRHVVEDGLTRAGEGIRRFDHAPEPAEGSKPSIIWRS